jgi:MFS family permease
VTGDTTGLGRLRLGVFIAYAFNGFALASWSVRIPSISAQLGLSTGEVGGFLLAGALGTLLTVTIAGHAVQRFGPRTTYLAATVAFVLAYLLLGLAANSLGFGALLVANVLHGGAFALTNVPQSILSAEAERRIGRTVIPQFHASYSIGAAAGAGLGGLAAGVGLSVLTQFVITTVLAVLVRGLVVRFMGRRPHPSKADRAAARSALLAAELPNGLTTPGRGRRFRFGRTSVWSEPQTLFIGLIVFGAALSEGAANNWMSVAVVDSFAAPVWQGAGALTVFLVAQTLGRLVGGPLVDRFGRLTMLRLSGLVSVVGVLAFATLPGLPFVFVGAALWGLGAALGVPISIAIAAADRLRGPSRVAAVTSLSSIANIAGPPVLGALGEILGIRLAIGVIAVVLVIGVVLARRAVGPHRGVDRAH